MEEKRMSENTEPKYAGNPTEPQKEKVRVIPIEYIDEFPNHPFKVLDDESMDNLVASIDEIGVQTPIVARRKDDERYEIISGHRRVHACKILGVKSIPAIVRELSLEDAIIAMVDANLQREHILPSEKAAAYKMKMDAMKKKAGRPSKENLSPLATNKIPIDTAAEIGETTGESRDQIFRYIRLNELVPELLELVDQERIAFRPAVEISYLTEDEQRDLVDCFDEWEVTPSLAQAIRLKKLSQEGKLDTETLIAIMNEEKPNQVQTVKFKSNEIAGFFPADTSPETMRKVIFNLLTLWQKNREKKAQSRDDGR